MAIKTKTKIKTKAPSLYLKEAWTKLLAQNERAKKGERLTDAQLTQEMTKLFPDRKGKTTLTRVNMIRSIYNKGSSMFESLGPAAVKSRRFDKNGDVIEGRNYKSPDTHASPHANDKKNVKNKKAVVAPVKTKARVKVKVKVRPTIESPAAFSKKAKVQKSVTYSSANEPEEPESKVISSAKG